MTDDLTALAKRFRGEGTTVAPETAAGGNLAALQSLANRFSGKDPSVSQAGVPDFGLRAGLSRQDTRPEQEQYLDKHFGPDGWSIDNFGRYVATVVGMERRGMPHDGRPVRIDEPGPSVEDVADITGDAPAIAGAVALPMLASNPFGWGAVALAGLGGMIGKAGQETYEHYAGENLQSLEDILADVGREGMYAAGGEGVVRALAPVGRWALAPSAKRMTDESRHALAQAQQIDVQPKGSQITGAPIISRFSGVMDRIFGDPLAVRNVQALKRETARLRNSIYPESVTAEQAGKNVRADIGTLRNDIGEWTAATSHQVDTITGGAPVIGTHRLKTAADKLIANLPKSVETGEPILANPELIRLTKQIGELPPYVTMHQQTELVNRLYSAVDDSTIIPGLASGEARKLWSAATKSFEDINPNVGGANSQKAIERAITEFRQRYRKRINELDDAIIDRITKDKTFANSVSPEEIVSVAFKPREHTRLANLLNILQPATQAKVRQVAFEQMLDGGTTPFFVRGPLGEKDFISGENLLSTLDRYGRESLIAMFGKEKVGELYRLGKVAKIISRKEHMGGGLVAAGVALHPIQNLPFLAKARLVAKYFNTPTGVRHLTDGLEMPKTRKGAEALARMFTQFKALAEDHTRELEAYQPVQPVPKTQGAPGPGL
tara:strand:- start:1470 stop:3464 length:1995 start_codon:yes stop_codon:yes gene_type:complete